MSTKMQTKPQQKKFTKNYNRKSSTRFPGSIWCKQCRIYMHKKNPCDHQKKAPQMPKKSPTMWCSYCQTYVPQAKGCVACAEEEKRNETVDKKSSESFPGSMWCPDCYAYVTDPSRCVKNGDYHGLTYQYHVGPLPFKVEKVPYEDGIQRVDGLASAEDEVVNSDDCDEPGKRMKELLEEIDRPIHRAAVAQLGLDQEMSKKMMALSLMHGLKWCSVCQESVSVMSKCVEGNDHQRL